MLLGERASMLMLVVSPAKQAPVLLVCSNMQLLPLCMAYDAMAALLLCPNPA